jgi:Flp pilus assembly protein TadG
MTNTRQAPKSDRRHAQRGQAMIEFALCFLLFLGTVVSFGQMAMAVWIKTTLHHAVREGARYAITGQTMGGAGQDSSIRQVVSRSTAGVLSVAQASSMVTIEFFDQSGAPTTSNAGGNTVVVSVRNYPVPMLVPAPVSYVKNALTVSAQAVARLEPYNNPPAR